MKWELEIDNRRQEVRDAQHLESLLRSDEVHSAVSVVLERVEPRQPSRFERLVYRLLGLQVPEHTPRGTLHLSLASDRAMAVFTKSDDEDGAIATVSGDRLPGIPTIQFVTPRGEPFSEPAECCIRRDTALNLLRAFYETGRRPRGPKWIPVAKAGKTRDNQMA